MEEVNEREPLVSIIVPVYKVEPYLAICIEDILAQSYPHIEVILVNDGSPDRCGEICEIYALKDHRIHVIHQKNGGVSEARNVGLDHARGDYIAFVDSDDRVHTQFIALMLQHIGQHKLLYCSYNLFDESEGVERKAHLHHGSYDVSIDVDPMEKIADVFKTIFVVPWNKLYAKCLWDQIRYPVGKIHEDEFVIHELLRAAGPIVHLDLPLYYYRMRKGSITADETNADGFIDKTEAIYQRRNFFLSQGRQREFKQLNTALLSRFALPTIEKNNAIWRRFSILDIFRSNQLPLSLQLFLVLKKVNYPIYSFLVRNGKRFFKPKTFFII
ncbi:glycosyltransferase family 2 protein [Pedobacter cryoconitis]|uniref:Glycosyltransferase involved in cell wall biosynthesis n=1 Tax=Pedobacter cryoconitis TaxID=188932 RepID=A0A7X0MJ02_9SPHI|nr:glycosyltransferase family 2 protein [Pedobacter cryoconitis]MBB6500972.1 glycosyltransferase involved in cell wall biosynthesis [Pedobacter cryoconitis]